MQIMTPMKIARLAAGLTAIELAARAGTLENRIYQIERGRFRPRVDEARRIAAALDSTVADIFPRLGGGGDREQV